MLHETTFLVEETEELIEVRNVSTAGREVLILTNSVRIVTDKRGIGQTIVRPSSGYSSVSCGGGETEFHLV